MDGLKVRRDRPPRMVSDAVRAAYAELLCRVAWTWFGTLSYRPIRDEFGRCVYDGPGPEGLRHHLKSFVNQVCLREAERRGLAVRGTDEKWRGWYVNRLRRGLDYPCWVAGIEAHRSGKLHAHLLFKEPTCMRGMVRRDAWKLWHDWHGRNEIKPPRVQCDVTTYVTKYVTKPGAELLLEYLDAPALPIANGVVGADSLGVVTR